MKLKTLLSFFAACLFAMSLNAQNFSNEDVPLFSASGPASANGQAPSKGTSQAKDFTSGPNCPADISTDVNPVSYATPTIDLFETQVSGSVDNSVSATDASADTRHVRIFDLGASGVGAMTINEVIIYQDGFDSNDPTDVVDITIYYAAAGSTPPFDVAGFTSVQTVANVSVGSATPGAMVTIPVSASIPAGVVLAIEIYEPGTNVTNFTVGYTDGASDDGSDTWIALGNPATTTIEPLSDFGLTSQVKIDFNATVEGTQSAGLASGSTFPGCTTTNTFDFMDFDGNTTSCSFDVTITDDVAPVIVCSPDVTFNTNPGLCQGTVDYSISAEDECGSGDLDNPGPLTFNLLTGSLPGSQFNVGTTVVTWEVVDEFGNTDMCSFSVTVIDNELPVILDCTDDITQTADAGVCEAAVSIPVPQINDFASDNCSDLTFTNDYNNGGDASGTYPVGTTTVIWTVADQQGNTVTCSFDVTITDDEAPVIASCASDQDVLTSSDGTGDCAALIPDLTAQVSWTDNCPGATLVQSPAAGDAFAGAHGDTQVVTFTATDAAGNSSVCTTTLTLVDDEDPTIDCSAIVTARDTDPGVCTFTMPGMGISRCPCKIRISQWESFTSQRRQTVTIVRNGRGAIIAKRWI
ncbi:MAG: HYR domain-containing protein, partial [Bacteroidota bacterium]